MPPFRDNPFQSRVYGLTPEEERELVDMYLQARGLRRNPNAPGGYEIVGPPSREKAQEALNRIRQRLLEKRVPELEGLQPAEEPPKSEDVSDAIREYFLPGGSGPATPTQTPSQGFQMQLPPPGRSIFMTEQREGRPLIPPTPRPIPRTGSRATVVTPPPSLLNNVRRRRMMQMRRR
ncbi:MAG: hypothetical protein QXT45_08080 [Candidatus Bilamarchaeaceae archaeon]